jgi:hypothetical protein
MAVEMQTMTFWQQQSPGIASSRGKFFGVPLGDLGLLTSLLMALAVAFITFFLVTFLAIVGIMVYNGMGHRMDYADSYKFISFPAGCLMLAISLSFFGVLWIRRKLSGKE